MYLPSLDWTYFICVPRRVCSRRRVHCTRFRDIGPRGSVVVLCLRLTDRFSPLPPVHPVSPTRPPGLPVCTPGVPSLLRPSTKDGTVNTSTCRSLLFVTVPISGVSEGWDGEVECSLIARVFV